VAPGASGTPVGDAVGAYVSPGASGGADGDAVG
jgi:hypothetical protein